MSDRIKTLMLMAAMIAGCAAEDAADQSSEPEQTEEELAQLGGNVGLKNIVASGPGCPPGTFQVSRSLDGMSATVSFRGFKTSARASATQVHQTCTVAATLDSAAGTSLLVSGVSLDSYVSVPRDAYVGHGVLYRIDGFPTTPRPPSKVTVGPRTGREYLSVPTSVSDDAWTPCGIDRQIQFDISEYLTNPTRSAASANVTMLRFKVTRRQC